MSQSIRHSELYAGQDWRVLHQAFSQINFNSYDFDTIRASMRDYIRYNYPEEFNDWIESSEFVALIDLLAYLGGMLAFRVDINAQENFMDTATARESILRLARILSYTPRRNYPARGIVKVTKVSTNDDIIDSNGINLNSAVVLWDDAQNPDWFEQWSLIMNAAFVSSNPFGQPLKTGTVGGVNTQLYRFNSIPTIGNLYAFNRIVSGKSMRFEIVNLDFENNGTYVERMPDPLASFHISYRNDGNGNASPNTGYFLYMKQGELRSKIIDIEEPVENRVIDINDTSINEIDVWVQSITDDSIITSNGVWKKVQTVDNNIFTGENVTYNSLDFANRNIYSVITGDNDSISLRFSDGRFGTIPQGLLRIYYRTSLGEQYTVRPQDIDNIDITIPYFNEQRVQKSLTLTLSLQQSITNSVPKESDEDIRRRASSVYYTQNRMVTGEDYHNFPIQNNLARKIKPINRVYSGHSRYIDLNDPTGTYQNVNVFSDDGMIFSKIDEQYFEMPINKNINQTSTSIMDDVIIPFVRDVKMMNFIIDNYLHLEGTKPTNDGPVLIWSTAENTHDNITGEFRKVITNEKPHDDSIGNTKVTYPSVSQSIGLTAALGNNDLAKLITEESLVKFYDAGWVAVNAISGDGSGIINAIGRVRLTSKVKVNDYILQVLPAFRTTFDKAECDAILDMLNDRKTFGVGYDYKNKKFYIIEPSMIKLNGGYDYATKGSTEDRSWLIGIEYGTDTFRIMARGSIYVFESKRDCRFYNFNDFKQYNNVTGLLDQDVIKILDINSNPCVLLANPWKRPEKTTDVITYNVGDMVINKNTYFRCIKTHNVTSSSVFSIFDKTTQLWEMMNPALGDTKLFSLTKPYVYRDGYVEPRRIQISFYDSDNNGIPDNPEIFYDIVGEPLTYKQSAIINGTPVSNTYSNENSSQYIFFEKYINTDNYEYYKPSTINPLRIRGVFSTYIDLTSPNIQQNIAVDVNGKKVLGKSTVIPNISSPDGGIPDGGLVLLTGQTQYESLRSDENNKIYRYHRLRRHDNDLSGELEELTDITQWLVNTPNDIFSNVITPDGKNMTNFNVNVLWDYDKKEFWLYKPSVEDGEYGTFSRDDTNKYDWAIGRQDLKFHWKHLAPRDHRIDPAITNIHDIYVLTSQYDTDMRNWVRTGKPRKDMPESPSELDLKLLFSDLENFKMFSDQIVWRPVKYKCIFGNRADEEYRVKFKTIKLELTTMSDGEIKAQIIRAINEFFVITNWDFGETFYWSDLSAYIHLRLQNVIASIVLVPFNEESSFGDLFEIPCMPDELLLSVATVDDVEIIKTNTQTNLRIR